VARKVQVKENHRENIHYKKIYAVKIVINNIHNQENHVFVKFHQNLEKVNCLQMVVKIVVVMG
jgi:hypothetical protein